MKTPAFFQSSRRGIVLAAAALITGALTLLPLDGKEAPKVKIDLTPLSTNPHPSFTFAPVIKRVSPSVVNIYTAKTSRAEQRLSPFMDDWILREFFGQGSGRWEMVPPQRREQSLGSGVIMSEDGYVLTNNHVVNGADEIKVALADNLTIYDAKIVGTDPQTDIAVLKVDAKNLPAISMTDSDRLDVGDVVLAIGNPFGVGQTVTMGIVSAKGRGGMGIVDYEDFIQTDASINPGNSGGALVDAGGRLVGINTAILSRTGGNQGIGFAIPANLARSVMDRLVTEGKVSRGYLGVMIQPVTPQLAKEFRLPDHTGALVGDVPAHTPAAEAGLRAGDVVVEMNGRKVNDSRHLRLMVGQHSPGTKITLKVIRDGKDQVFEVKLGEAPLELVANSGNPRDLRSSTSGVLGGIRVEDLDSRARRQFELPDHVRSGALIAEVKPGSPADEAGLKAGDVILEIDRQPVRNAGEALEISRRPGAGHALLRVWGAGGSRYVVVDTGAKR